MHREREKLKLFQVCVKKKMNCRVKEKSSYFHVSFIFYNMHVNLVVGIAQLNEKKKKQIQPTNEFDLGNVT